jgi:4-amino-4-deoxy-L-arabinose transferase-like glycosyltransferase
MYAFIKRLEQHHRLFVLSVIALGLLLRLLWFFTYTRHEQNFKIAIDSDQYHEIAQQVSHNNGIVWAHGSPNFLRLPFYPTLLGFIYKIGTQFNALLFQVVLSALIPFFVYVLAGILIPHNMLISTIALLCSAFHPGLIYFSGVLSTETIFLIVFLMFLMCFFQAMKERSARLLVGAGICLGLASLTRPLGEYIFLLTPILFFFLYHDNHVIKKIIAFSVFVCSYFSIVGIWIARNYMLTGMLFLHTLTGDHLLRYNAARIVSSAENIDYNEAKHELFNQSKLLIQKHEHNIGRTLNVAEKDTIAQSLARSIMIQHPFLTIRHACKEIYNVAFSRYSSLVIYVPHGVKFEKDTPVIVKVHAYLETFRSYPIIIPFILLDWCMYLFILLGFMLFLKYSFHDAERKRLWLSICPIIIIVLASALSLGLVRLRIPAEPLLIIAASYGWGMFLERQGISDFKKTLYAFLHKP